MIDKKQPIIIKKIIKNEAGHHGGAWKVAFADFVTAMMAFFLLMWLVSSTSVEQKAAISEYFDNPSMTVGASPAPAPSTLFGEGGANVSMIDLSAIPIVRQNEKKEDRQKDEQQSKQEKIEKQEAEKDKERLDELMEKLKAAIEKSQALKPFKDQLLLDITPEGLRIQIVDKENRAMFGSGSAELEFYTVDILMELAKVISGVPNKISLSGHTDTTRFAGADDYSNWELSADRANAARRALLFGGLSEEKVGRVVGLSSSTLFDKQNPTGPINRRIAIIVMNKKTEAAIARGEGVSEQIIQQRGDLFEVPQLELPMELLENSAPLEQMQAIE